MVETFPPFPSQLASLLTLFRQSQPELFAYFEDEQVRYVEVASSWLTTMLSKEMWLGDVLRLWGKYRFLIWLLYLSAGTGLRHGQTRTSPRTTCLACIATFAWPSSALAKSESSGLSMVCQYGRRFELIV